MFIFVTFLTFMEITTHSKALENVNKQFNDLYNTNEEIETITNELFTKLGLKQILQNTENIKHVLKKYYMLRSVIEINYEIYEMIREICKYDNQEIYSAYKFNEIIEELVYENSVKSKSVINITNIVESAINDVIKLENISLANEKNIHNNENGKRVIDRELAESSNDYSKSEETMSFADGLLQKINNLTINDFIDRSQNTSGNQSRRNMKYYNLKTWQPSDTNQTRRYFKSRRCIFEYPFVVSIHVDGEFKCAGSIISKTFIITAASCMEKVYRNRFKTEKLPTVSVRIGSNSFHKFGELIPIVTLFFHHNYNASDLKNNLALLKMEKHTYFRRNKSIRRIDYDTKTKNIIMRSKQVKLMTWGKKLSNITGSDHGELFDNDLNILNIKICKTIYSSKPNITGSNFCACSALRSTGICSNIVGGPAVVNGVLVGVVSFVPACEANHLPTVFSKISCFSYWIQSVLKGEQLILQANNRITSHLYPGKLKQISKTGALRDNDLKGVPKQIKVIKDTLLSQSKTLVDNILFNFNGKSKLVPETVSVKYHKTSKILHLAKDKQQRNLFIKTTPLYQKFKDKLLSDNKSNQNSALHKAQVEQATKTEGRAKILNASNNEKLKIPENYDIYSENDSSDDGLSIDVTIPKNNKIRVLDTQANRKDDDKSLNKIQVEKYIENHFLDILQNILKATTSKKFKNIFKRFNQSITISGTEISKYKYKGALIHQQ